jgi:hypothetical protein
LLVALCVASASAHTARQASHLVPTGKGWAEERSDGPGITQPPTGTVPIDNGISYHDGLIMPGNDTISGPKKGVSQILTLKVHSRAQEHQNMEKLQEEMAAAVLDMLADHLDLAEQLRSWQEQAEAGKPAPSQEALQQSRDQQRAAMERAEELTRQIEQAMEYVQHDPFSTYESFADMQALQRNMAHLQNTLLPQLQQSLQSVAPQTPSAAQLQAPKRQLEAAVQELERLSSLADHIAKSSHTTLVHWQHTEACNSSVSGASSV